jgi:hypothetical protein
MRPTYVSGAVVPNGSSRGITVISVKIWYLLALSAIASECVCVVGVQIPLLQLLILQ